MLDANKIHLANYSDFAREIDVDNLPAVQDFTKRFIWPSSADEGMSDAFGDALAATKDSAFVVGFNTVVRFLMDCMKGGNGQ